MFGITIFGGVDDGYTSAEVSYDDAIVAIVHDSTDGWQIELFGSDGGISLPELIDALKAAQSRLSEYVNRRGDQPPEGLTRAGMSLWLMERTDGSAMGIKLGEPSE